MHNSTPVPGYIYSTNCVCSSWMGFSRWLPEKHYLPSLTLVAGGGSGPRPLPSPCSAPSLLQCREVGCQVLKVPPQPLHTAVNLQQRDTHKEDR